MNDPVDPVGVLGECLGELAFTVRIGRIEVQYGRAGVEPLGETLG
jgi:hypothetical protein